jgi:ribosomal protein L40E
MTTEHKKTETKNLDRSDKGVLCAKCEHLNPPGTNECRFCGAHLYVTCHACGVRNPRVNARCCECKRSMHRTFWGKWARKLTPKKSRYKLWHFILLAIAVFITYKVIINLAEFSTKPR